MMQEVSLIFDIGKTNKKLLLFDAGLHLVHEQQTAIPEIEGEQGTAYDDLVAMRAWLADAIAALGREKKYNIRAINVTTFGATVVHLDRRGEVAGPVYSYTTPVDDTLSAAYRAAMEALPGGFTRLATPPLDMLLNAGKQLFWLAREKPAEAEKIATTLFLPQYFVYELTGAAISETTSLGCHTGLWDFAQMQICTEALRIAGWEGKLPPLVAPQQTFRLKDTFCAALGAQDDIPVGTGLHDSSSALLPFSRALPRDFVLVSTGTWIITLNPGAVFALTEKDLREDRLYYLTPEQKPVRAARVFAGREHDHQLDRITAQFGRPPATRGLAVRGFLPAFFAEIEERSLIPAKLKGSGPFPDGPAGQWRLADFASPEEAYARLCLDLAVLASYCIDSVAEETTEKIVVDGGFAQNAWFVGLLAALQAPRTLLVTELPQATALGAALAVHGCWAGKVPLESIFALDARTEELIPGLRLYAERYLAKMEGESRPIRDGLPHA